MTAVPSSEFIVKPFSPSQPRLLLAEGKDDVALFETLRVQRQLPDIEITDFRGKDNLRPYLKGLVLDAGFSSVVSLGVARDADSDPAGAVESVRSALRDAGLSVPVGPLVTAGKSPSVTFMITPPGGAIGALEEMCLEAWAGDAGLQCVDAYFMCAAAAGLIHETGPKPRTHVMLASRPQFKGRLEYAIQSGFVPLGTAIFDPVEVFLKLLTA